MMIDRMKTILLILLVALSFYLTYLLWGNNPSFDLLIPGSYEQPKKIGVIKAWKDLIKPKEILFHYKENRHTIASSNMAPYRFLWDALQKWQFLSVKEVKLETADWKEILENSSGVEFNFSDTLPSLLLAKLVQLPDNVIERMSTIDRIWVYEQQEDSNFAVLFISSHDRKVYAGKLIDIKQDTYFDLRNLIELGSQLTEQYPVLDRDHYFQLYYLPLERSAMTQWTYETSKIGVEEMIEALFVDTSAMKEISERSGTRIFTDGTKSLQYNESTYDMRFFIPYYEQPVRADKDEELLQTLDFMNNHQGWTGEYYFDEWKDELDHSQIVFRENMDGYPLYSDSSAGLLGEISIKNQPNLVSEYTRSLIQVTGIKRFYQITIISGKELFDLLEEKGIYMADIKNIELGYQAIYETSSSDVKLVPAYIIHLHALESPIIMDARAFSVEG